MTEQEIDEINNFIMMWPDDQPKESLFVSKLFNKGFRPEQIIVILKTIDETCNNCWDNNENIGLPGQGCTCTRDE